MICIIDKLQTMPGHFAAYPERLAAWEKSMGAWEVRYGSLDGRRTHTAAYFGFVQEGVSEAWVWADVLQRHPNRGMLKSAKIAWNTFAMQRPWTLHASCKTPAEVNFARFFGFELIGFDERGSVMERAG